FVVVGGHPVERWVELGAFWIDAFVGLLEGQRDAATVEVDVDDLDVEDFVDGCDLLGGGDVTVGQLGDVDQVFDAVFDADECTEWYKFGDLARNDLAQCVGAGEDLPWVFLGRFERQGDAFAVHIDVEYFDGDFLTDFDNL